MNFSFRNELGLILVSYTGLRVFLFCKYIQVDQSQIQIHYRKFSTDHKRFNLSFICQLAGTSIDFMRFSFKCKFCFWYLRTTLSVKEFVNMSKIIDLRNI